MKPKELFQKTFDKYLNKEEIYQEIQKKIEKKEKRKGKFIYLIPATCIILLTIGLFISAKPLHGSFLFEENQQEDAIIINSLDQSMISLRDYDIKCVEITDESHEQLKQKYSFLSRLAIPSGISLTPHPSENRGCAVYTKEPGTNDYSKLYQYEYYYKNVDYSKSIVLAFSKLGKPFRDYYFMEDATQLSTINGNSVLLYGSDSFYIAQFTYQGTFFDIDAKGINEQEFLKLIDSILQ